MANPLSPVMAAELARRVYLLKDQTISEFLRRDSLGCEGHFKVDDNNRFSGKAGIIYINQLSGFGYIAEGEGARQGEILVATRGTKTFYDLLTDGHIALRRGPGGQPVHLGFLLLLESFMNDIRAFMHGRNPTHIHCVGHSLGGALATLTADYFAALKLPVTLYTFGCPRVGTEPFCESLTARMGADNIYRVAHSTDPVTMVPAFPFLHVPVGGKNYTVSKSGLVRITEHFMNGYIDSVEGKSWGSLVNTTAPAEWSDVVARAWLDAAKEHKNIIAMHSAAGLNVIAQALRWLVRKALGIGLDAVCLRLSDAFTAADIMATLVNQAAAISKETSDDTLTIMNAVLQFLGRTAAGVKEVTAQFIKWVFDLLVGTLHHMANQALMGIDRDR